MALRVNLFISLFVMLACVFYTQMAQAKHLYYEIEYQNKWCSANNGKQEVVLYDGLRADCELPDYIIEFDFANKYREAIAQSLEYAVRTGKQPGIVLIIENPLDDKYYKRLMLVADRYKIKVWTMKPEDMK